MVKRDSVKISMNEMAEAIADSNTCDFFTESMKLKGPNINLSKTIENASNDADIANLFGKKYDELTVNVLFSNANKDIIINL